MLSFLSHYGTAPDLELGFFIGTDDEVFLAQGNTLPPACAWHACLRAARKQADRWQKSRQGFSASFSQNKNKTILDNAFTDVAG